jgi:rhodanese-related sulfurtransferase
MPFKTITREQLKSLFDRGETLQLVDIRPYSAYYREHIRGAINLPLEEINDKAVELLDSAMPAIIYGEDEKDAMVARAAEQLLVWNFSEDSVTLLDEGLVGWRGAGYYTSSGDEMLK